MAVITQIKVKHIRGIDNLDVSCELFPNKPNFLVAPNGSGKSSLAVGFSSLNRDRLRLNETDYFNGQKYEDSCISIKLDDGTMLFADREKNEISKRFGVSVINSGLYAKQTSRYFAGRSISEATISIPDITIRKTIPPATKINYSVRNMRKVFPSIGQKLFFNFLESFSDPLFVTSVLSSDHCYKKLVGPRQSAAINDFLKQLFLPGSKNVTPDSDIDFTKIKKLTSVNKVASLLKPFMREESDAFRFFNAIQLIRFCSENINNVKAHSARTEYRNCRARLDKLIKGVNTTNNEIKTFEEKGTLKLRFPNRSEVSNGELDIIKFISALFCAQDSMKKTANILIIDEVFDYLDDGNLLVAQHFLLKMMEQHKESGRSLYVVILTHIDPSLMGSYRFKTKHVSYFGESPKENISPYMLNILKDRLNCKNTMKVIYNLVSQHYLHYSEASIKNEKLEAYFRAKQLPEHLWTPTAFGSEMNNEVERYLKGEPYDATKVCCGLRRCVEKYAFNQLGTSDLQKEYLDLSNGTQERLKFAEENGVMVPELMHLLSSVYNSCMHLNGSSTDKALVYRKLNNMFIQSMVKSVFETVFPDCKEERNKA